MPKDRRSLTGRAWVVLQVLWVSSWVASSMVEAQEPFVEGRPLVGNGLQDGSGATLARIFVQASELLEGAGPIPLELRLSSGVVTAEPLLCNPTLDATCPGRRFGSAGSRGFPSEESAGVWRLKLAAAQYLPGPSGAPGVPSALRGVSLEVAFEAALTLGREPVSGSEVQLRLLVGDESRLRSWGAQPVVDPEDRFYANFTGAGLLTQDTRVGFFPGIITGVLANDTGNTLVIRLEEYSPLPLEDDGIDIAADPAAAEAAGLPKGTFGVIEINYTGLPSVSRVFPGAVTNDVDLHIPSEPRLLPFVRGDCNGDGIVAGNVSDAVALLNFNFASGVEPPCLEACDADGDGRATGQVTDAVYLLLFGFLGGPPPMAPFPDCGSIEEPALGCGDYECRE